jgi:hypothetical protein
MVMKFIHFKFKPRIGARQRNGTTLSVFDMFCKGKEGYRYNVRNRAGMRSHIHHVALIIPLPALPWVARSRWRFSVNICRSVASTNGVAPPLVSGTFAQHGALSNSPVLRISLRMAGHIQAVRGRACRAKEKQFWTIPTPKRSIQADDKP